jgi:NTE family protein
MQADAVFEGGGVRGIALVGALAAAEEAGYTEWVNVAGTSVGAVVASLVAAGYRAAEIKDLMDGLDIARLRQAGFGGPGVGLLLRSGMYSLLPLERWLEGVLARRGLRTFGDRVLPGAEPRYRHRLQVIATDLARRAMVLLPRDAGAYGVQPDAMPVATAVRMSSSIPLYFRPVRWRDGVFVDGGLLSDFPVWLFDQPGAPAWPTFGFRFQDATGPARPRPVRWAWDVAVASVEAMFLNQDVRRVPGADVARVIEVPTLGIQPTDFDLTPAQRQALYQAGYDAGRRFFARWDFAAHVAARAAAGPAEASAPPVGVSRPAASAAGAAVATSRATGR